MNWLEIIPKGILVNLNISMLLGMNGLLMSFSHRNLVTSRSCSWRLIWRKVFSISATMAVSYVRNLRSNEQKSSKITGPRYRDLFKLRFLFLAFADASYTIFSFVVRLFGLITPWRGMYCFIYPSTVLSSIFSIMPFLTWSSIMLLHCFIVSGFSFGRLTVEASLP